MTWLEERMSALRRTAKTLPAGINENRQGTVDRASLPSAYTAQYVSKRDSPKGTRVISQTPEAVVLQFRAALRTWWIVPYVMLPIVIIGCLPLALFVGTYLNPRQSSAWLVGSLFWVPVLLIGANIALFLLTQRWVKLIATREYILVGSQFFRRADFGGMRIGYVIEFDRAILKNDFQDISLGLQGLRLVYGPWGEDLQYLLNRYHAPEIVLWLNMMIDATAAPSAPKVSETGVREQKF